MRPCDIKNIQTVKDQINNNKQWAAKRGVMLLIRGKDANIRVEASSRDPKQPGKAFGVLQAIVNKVNKEFFAGEQIMENPKNGLDFKFSNLTFTKPVLDKLQEVFRSTIKRDVEKNREITPRDIQGVLSNYKDSTISIKEGNEYVVNGEVYPTYGDALEASKKDDDLIFSTNGDIVSKEEQQANIKRLKEQFFPTSDTSSASKILSKIASSNHPLNQVAKHLMKYASINDVVVVLKDAEYFINSTNNIKGIGKYTFSKNRIDIAAKSGSIKIETLLLHEILHALSYRTLRNNTEYSKNFRKLYEKSKEKLGEFDDKSLQGEYANYTIDEFFVAIFTDSAFIKKLQSLEAINVQKYPNLFEEIIDYLLSILGFVSTDNLYSQAMAVASNIIQHEYDTQQYIIMENEYYDSLQEPLFSISEQQPSNNLDTASNNNEITEIDDSLYNSILNQLEQENIIKRDCNGKGRLKAEKGLQTSFTKGGKWEIYEIFEGKSHKQGGIDINIKNNQISFTNKNGNIKARYGLVLPFMEDVIKEGGPGEGEDSQHSVLKTPIKGMKEELSNKLYDDLNAKKAYVNSDAFARRALEFAPDKIKNDPKKAASWLADRRQDVYYNLNPKISVEPTPFNAAGEWDRQGRKLLIDPEYVKYSQEISRHENQHMTHATFLEEPKFDKMVASRVRDRKNLDINTPEGERLSKLNTANYYATAIDEISAYTGTLRQYLEESFNLSPGDAITKEHYDKFINIIKSDPDKYRFLNSQLKNLKILLAPEGEQSDNFITEFMNKLVSNEKPKSTSNNRIQTAQYGKLIGYDKNTDTYIATPLKEFTVTTEAPQWLKYKRDYEKTNPKSNYINNYLTPFAKSLGNTETNYPKRLDEEYEQKSLDYVSEQLVKNKPQGKLSRAEWLNQMSDKEEELIKRNPKYQSSLWADTKRGLTSLVEQNPLHTFQNILSSSDYTSREKREMLKDYADHPIMSKLGDAAKILNPLSVPSKMVQSAYKDDYSFSDALKGKKNNAGIVEDIVTDPLNLVGAGLIGKLSKAGSNLLNKTDDVIKNLPKLEQVPLDFKIEDVLKNISSTERKNMEIVKKGNAYFKELDNPESLKRLKEFGDEYGIDLLDAYKKAEKRWDYGNNIGKNDRFQVAGKEIFKDDIESALGLSTVTDDYFKMKMLKPKSKTLIPENKTEVDKYSINYVNKKASLKDYDTIVWHELSHDINKNIIGQSTKLQRDLSDIFVKNIDEVDKTKIESAFKSQKFDTYEKGLVKSKKEKMSIDDIAKDELAYVSKPTETWAFLSTNLRQDLKNTGVIKNYNELLTPEKLEQAIKNGNTVFSRFEPYIKDKEAFIKLFNKMTLSIAPAVLYLQSQNQNKTEQ